MVKEIETGFCKECERVNIQFGLALKLKIVPLFKNKLCIKCYRIIKGFKEIGNEAFEPQKRNVKGTEVKSKTGRIDENLHFSPRK